MSGQPASSLGDDLRAAVRCLPARPCLAARLLALHPAAQPALAVPAPCPLRAARPHRPQVSNQLPNDSGAANGVPLAAAANGGADGGADGAAPPVPHPPLAPDDLEVEEVVAKPEGVDSGGRIERMSNGMFKVGLGGRSLRWVLPRTVTCLACRADEQRRAQGGPPAGVLSLGSWFLSLES